MSLGSEPWVEWFCRSHPQYVEVEEEYIRDEFNLTGLANLVPGYEQALDIILDNDFDDTITDETASDHSYTSVNRSAEMLYGLIHARYILTTAGLNAMWDKYLDMVYGLCPRDCDAATMPFGMSNLPGLSCTAVYCGVCKEVYRPASPVLANIDGSHFGSTFCHLFFLEFADRLKVRVLRDTTKVRSGAIAPPESGPPYYVPKIFGYKVSPMIRDKKIREAPLTGSAANHVTGESLS